MEKMTMNRVRYENPFVVGNLSDLEIARGDNDLEYLKEWTKKAVPWYQKVKQNYVDLLEESMIVVSKGE